MADPGKSDKDSNGASDSDHQQEELDLVDKKESGQLKVKRSRSTGLTTIEYTFKLDRRSAPQTFDEWRQLPHFSGRPDTKAPTADWSDADVLLSTWAWILDILLEVNVDQWSAAAQGKRPKPWFRGRELNIAHISSLITGEMETKTLNERTVRKHIQSALKTISGQWKQQTVTPTDRELKTMYVSLYYLVKATIHSCNEQGNSHTFDLQSPEAVVLFLSNEFGRPAGLDEAQVIACLNHCWD